MALQDWNSIFQLACGFNLVLGSYTRTRKEREDAISQLLDETTSQLNIYRGLKGVDLKMGDRSRDGLQKIPWDNMSEHELNAYRRDVTNRFWAGVYRRRTLDKVCGALLAIAGSGSVAFLFWAALAPNRNAEPVFFAPLSAILLVVPLGIMLRISIESRALDTMTRAPNRSNAKKSRRKTPFHSTSRRGEIHLVTSHIRRLLRETSSRE